MGLLLGFRFGLSPDYLPVLRALGRADWHTSHENIAMALDRLKDPESVDVLFHLATTKYAYLAYDDAYALAVKAIYALAKIGTADTVRRLRDLQNSTNKIIVNAATSRLRELANPSPDDGLVKFEANNAQIDDTRPPVAEFALPCASNRPSALRLYTPSTRTSGKCRVSRERSSVSLV